MKPNELCEPRNLTRSQFNTLGTGLGLLEDYVDACLPFMAADLNTAVARLEIKDEQGVPVLKIIPDLKIINIIKTRLEAKK